MAFKQSNNPFVKLGGSNNFTSGRVGAYTDDDGFIYSGRGAGGGHYQGLTSDQDGFHSFYSGTDLGSQNRPGAKYGEATLGRYDSKTGKTYYHFAGGRSTEKLTPADIDYYKKEFGYDITTSDSAYKPKPKKESATIDWAKIDTSRRQRAANTAKYGMTRRESRKFQRQQNRATRRLEREQRRDARRLKRQVRRRNEGGFFRRLFT